MNDVKVSVSENDKYIAAMARALAFAVAGQSSVAGATEQFLKNNGYIVMHFQSDLQVVEFRRVLSKHLATVARIVE